jgi:hypothetical protein
MFHYYVFEHPAECLYLYFRNTDENTKSTPWSWQEGEQYTAKTRLEIKN